MMIDSWAAQAPHVRHRVLQIVTTWLHRGSAHFARNGQTLQSEAFAERLPWTVRRALEPTSRRETRAMFVER